MPGVTAMALSRAHRSGSIPAHRSTVVLALSAVAVAAWALTIAADVSGIGPLLHHHSLIEGGATAAPPLLLAVGLALVSWQVMVAGMMVPASLPAIDLFARTSRVLSRPGIAILAFLGAFAVTWMLFGFAAFLGDFALHHVVDASPWLTEHQSLVLVGSLALAGAYQFTPFKHRWLAACRLPMTGELVGADHARAGSVGLRAGWSHAVDCVGASGPLMLLMFAAGFANLVWMALLTGVMVYEARGRAGHLAAFVVGAILLGLAGAALWLGGLPGWRSA